MIRQSSIDLNHPLRRRYLEVFHTLRTRKEGIKNPEWSPEVWEWFAGMIRERHDSSVGAVDVVLGCSSGEVRCLGYGFCEDVEPPTLQLPSRGDGGGDGRQDQINFKAGWIRW